MTDALSDDASSHDAHHWVTLLGTSLRQEQDYVAEVRGRWPTDLRGTLFRNGPGLFERDGVRKRMVTDGDGMIRAYDIGDGTVRFRSKFIRTTKFREEEAASRYKYATWSTRAPGGILRNLGGGRRRSQAEATVIVRHGKLLAFDEIGLPWSLDPHTLNTTSRYQIGAPSDRPAFKSRTKIDPITGDWLALGNDYVEPLKLRVLVENAQGLSKTELSLRLPRKSYFRDFFTTARFVVVGLNAVEINTLSATLGLAPILSAIRWKPSIGNIAVVIPKNGDDPFAVDAPPSWCFHTINAYESGNEIIADFVGHDSPEWLLGKNPALGAVMRGVVKPVEDQGKVRRWRIDLNTRRLREEIVDETGHEYPTVDPLRVGLPYRHAYLATARPKQWWTSGTVRLDMESGARDAYEARSTQTLGEPVFVPREGGGADEGWLLVESLDGEAGVTSLLLFNAGSVASGPIAEAVLRHHLPFSEHGSWMSGT
ncbi:MAG: carotenoid oxygenase family protein [Proteobacteria bacterium]|nr:carotenoid oxygenase family protein [Pseudomonadota bacterium]MDA1059355.1 carotenoid oxygenase family protein [Pseudomonadota bacterium]